MEWVVHCRKSRYDVYCGRPSKWGNPYSHKEGTLAKFKTKTRQEAIDKYEEWIRSQPQMIEDLKELKGQVLSCWCKPLNCHCDILVKLIKEFHGN